MCVEEAMYSGDTPAPRISRSWGATLSVFQPFWGVQAAYPACGMYHCHAPS